MNSAIFEFGGKHYVIYDNGDIFDIDSKRFIQHSMDSSGYVVVNLGKTPNRACKKLHRLLGEFFLPNPFAIPISELTINHKDYNKSNNDISNLEWMTREDNARDSYKRANHPQRGGTNKMAKLSEEKVCEIKKMLPMFSDLEISKLFGVHNRTIYDIRHGKTWKHII